LGAAAVEVEEKDANQGFDLYVLESVAAPPDTLHVVTQWEAALLR